MFTLRKALTRRNLWLLATSILLFGILTGCGQEKTDNGKQSDDDNKSEAVERVEPVEVKKDPVTLKVGLRQSWMTDEEFTRYIVDPVKNKYPWITVEREPYTAGRSLRELITIGETPDLVAQTNVLGMPDMRNLELFASFDEGLIKKHNLDLNRFEPEVLEALKAATQMDGLPGIPYTRHFSALYYNKDVFDKFGENYPPDGMTWDQTYELARKLTRMEDGVQYRGLNFAPTERPASQLSLPYVDMNTKKTLINTDPWNKVMQFAAKVHQISGNEQIVMHVNADNLFARTRTLAMHATINILFEAKFEEVPDLNWDFATYPVWPEAPGIGMRIDMHAMMLSSATKHEEEAFLVATTLASDEVQMNFSRHGRFSVLNNQKIRDAFGANLSFLKGKNVEAIFKTKPAKPFIPTEYDSIAMDAINKALEAIIKDGVDVNTALRQAEENVNKQIEEREASK